MLKHVICGFAVGVTLLMATHAFAGDPPIYAPEGIAIGGYDPVAYVKNKRAQKGDPAFAYQWREVTWHFANKRNKKRFIKAPERYLPAFGGFCALGVAHGALVPADPTAWTVHDGKVILNQSGMVATTWRYNPDINLERAGAAYPDAQELYASWQARRRARQPQEQGDR